jgi:replicative DNA helicase
MITGLATGFIDLDKLTSGFQASDLIIIAGRPSMGKTAFCLNIAAHAALEHSKTVAIFSLEMAKEQLGLRMLCSEARVDAHKLRTGYLAESDWGKLSTAAGRLAEAPIYIDDTGAIGVLEMRSKARRLKMDRGLDLIIVDYLQLMRGRGEDSREQELPIVALSQLNRAVETRGKDKRPLLADLRESGAIEQDADVILFIYREEQYNKCECPWDGECLCGRRGKAEVIIGKQRNGPTDIVDVTYLKQFTRFENAEKRSF